MLLDANYSKNIYSSGGIADLEMISKKKKLEKYNMKLF
jgi:hypothetical protein